MTRSCQRLRSFVVLVADPAPEQPPADDVPTPMPAPPRLGYQPALDGLRAFAVVAVLLYHGGVSWASGGYLGVDVFFVLSGFLITTLLVEEWRGTGRIGIGSFYVRRARRLFPALVPVLAFVAYFAVALAPDSQLASIRNDVLATLGYVMNWRLVAAGRGYFDAFTGLSPLKHTWSLAVEEQWYVVWPVVAALLLGRRAVRGRLRLAAVVTAALLVASAVWMVALARPGVDPSRVYYGTDTRAQELLMGALLAFVCALAGTAIVRLERRRLLDLAGVCGFGALLALCAWVGPGTHSLYEGGMTAFAALVALVVLSAVQPGGLLRRALGLPPLRYVGLLSYGLYLWHFPIYVAATPDRMGFDGTRLLLFRLAAAFGAAALSYHLVERGIRLRRVSNRQLLQVFPALGVVAVLVVVGAAHAAGSAPPDLPPEVVKGPGLGADMFVYDPSTNPMPAIRPGEQTPRVALTGDSSALTLGLGYRQRGGPAPILLWTHSVLGCSMFPGERVFGTLRTDGGPQCKDWRDDRDRWMREFRPDVVAVLSGVWEVYDRIVDGRTLRVGTAAYDRWFGDQLDAFIAKVDSYGGRTVFLTPPCNRRERDITGVQPPENDPRRLAAVTQLYRAAAVRAADKAAVVDFAARVCPSGRYDADLRSDDGVHYSGPGAEILRQWLFPRLVALVPDKR
jgi:peptidoglycan/LPS O-acetylase OafA/YrhL